MDADYSHRNILIQGHIPKLLFQAKIVQGADASKRRVKSPSHMAFEQKEKELTGLVRSFLWLSKTFPASTLRCSSRGARACFLTSFGLRYSKKVVSKLIYW
jgi:hypothetical protein